MRLCAAVAVVTLLGVTPATGRGQAGEPAIRVFETSANREIALEAGLAAMSRADVVFIGEEPSDTATHRAELQLLRRLSQLRGDIFLALEAFARDVQEPLDHFQMGHMDDRELAEAAHLDPAVLARYKPIADHAVTAKWPIIAPGLPERIAADVTAAGLGVLRTARAGDAALFAREWACSANEPRARQAACLGEETIAESIASTWTIASLGGKPPLVVSINDRARIDGRRGVVERTAGRLPRTTIVTIQVAPVAKIDDAALGAGDRPRADYVVFVAADAQ
jgi:hypothetical protein